MPESANAISDITIFARYKTESWKLGAVADLVVSWELNRPGMMSFRVPTRQLLAMGAGSSGTILDLNVWSSGGSAGSQRYASDLLGKWVEYRHPTAGFWGGRISSVHHDDGITSVGAEGYLSLLKGRRYVPKDDGSAPADTTIAQYLKAALTAAESDEPLGFTPFDAGNKWGIQGNSNAISPAEGDLLDDVIPAVLDIVDNRMAVVGVQASETQRKLAVLGLVNMAASVQLSKGVEITGWSYGGDLWAGSNTVRARTRFWYSTGSGKKTVKKRLVRLKTGIYQPSVARFGRIETESVQLRGTFNSESQAATRANDLALKEANQFFQITLRLADVNNCFARLEGGNDYGYSKVLVDLGELTGGPVTTTPPPLRIESKSLDVARGEMTVAVMPW